MTGVAEIHSTAIVSPGAIIGSGSTVGPYSIIGPDVVIGVQCRIGPHVVIEGHTTIGDGNRVFQFASIGSQPQDLKFKGEASKLLIGNRNIIREFVTLQPGTEGGGMLTTIGDENLFMANTHVGHDSRIGNRCVFANSAALAGHVTVGSGVIVGGLSGIHQFVRLGDISLVAAGAMVEQDIPPFCYAQGDRATLAGINRIGLQRNRTASEEVALIKRVYRAVIIGAEDSRPLKERCQTTLTEVENAPLARALLNFVLESSRGIPRHRSTAESRSQGGEE